MKTPDEKQAKGLEITYGMINDGFTVEESMSVLATTLAVMANKTGLSQHQTIDNFITTVKAVEGALK